MNTSVEYQQEAAYAVTMGAPQSAVKFYRDGRSLLFRCNTRRTLEQKQTTEAE